MLLGGICFWGSDALFMAAGGLVPLRVWLVAKSILLPAAVVTAVLAISRSNSPGCSPPLRCWLMLAGIWILGPAYSLLVNRAYYARGVELGEILFTIALFPLSTIVYATYSGALGGLAIASVFLVIYPLFARPGD
jgi:hypothetical protein